MELFMLIRKVWRVSKKDGNTGCKKVRGNFKESRGKLKFMIKMFC